MADVFPPRNLPGRAEAWGRAVEGGIRALEKSEVQLSQKMDNSLRATSGQLAVLSQQISDLTGRTSLSSADHSTHNYNTSSENNLPSAALTFSLDRPRKVRLTFSAQVMANTHSVGVNTAAGHLTFNLDGSEVFPNEVARGFVSAMSTAGGFLHSSSSANALLSLPAGTYTVMPRVTVTIVGTAAITVENSFLFVDILEPM